MDVKEAAKVAKDYVVELFADEHISNLGLDEAEHDQSAGRWIVTVGFSRPWNTPRTRAQEVLENLGGVSGLRRSYKTITIADDGEVISMKNRVREDASD